MSETALGAIEAPLVPLGGLRRPKLGRLLRSPFVLVPLVAVPLLIVADVQQAGAQAPADCSKIADSFGVTVPKTHIPMIGWLTGAMDNQTQLRDVMALKHPEVALTQVVSANPDQHLSPMGTVPATSGGIACVKLPQVVATSPQAPAKAGIAAPKD